MKNLPYFIVFVLGLIAGVGITRFMYAAAINITSFLVVAVAVLFVAFILWMKIKSDMREKDRRKAKKES